MATYLQQNLHFHPCQKSMVKKSFEQVLKDIGAKKAPNYGQQCWQLKKDVIFYSVRNTKTGVTLVYKIYEEEEFFEEKAQKVRTRINDKVKESFPPQKEASEQLSLKSDKFAAYTIGEDVENNSGSFLQRNQWIWGVFGVIFAVFMILNWNGTITKKIMSPSSNDPAYYQHPTGDPKEDAATYHKMLHSGDVQGANQFADEVRDLYLQDFVNDRGAKLDEFWEWNAKMK